MTCLQRGVKNICEDGGDSCFKLEGEPESDPAVLQGFLPPEEPVVIPPLDGGRLHGGGG